MTGIQLHIAENLRLRAVVKTKQEQWAPSTTKNPSLNESLEVSTSQTYTQPEASSITAYLYFFQAIMMVSQTITRSPVFWRPSFSQASNK